jgi:hypothetical protein
MIVSSVVIAVCLKALPQILLGTEQNLENPPWTLVQETFSWVNLLVIIAFCFICSRSSDFRIYECSITSLRIPCFVWECGMVLLSPYKSTQLTSIFLLRIHYILEDYTVIPYCRGLGLRWYALYSISYPNGNHIFTWCSVILQTKLWRPSDVGKTYSWFWKYEISTL